MVYEIVRGVEPAAPTRGNPNTAEREAMMKLEVGDGFYITDKERAQSARWTRYTLSPKKFTITKIEGATAADRKWQVRRIL